jgi:hypothetical protein
MAADCGRCGRRHQPVGLADWLWEFRDAKKPTPAQLAVLVMLAARMDPVTGCGWTTREQLADDAQVDGATVGRALRWGRDRLLIHQARRGTGWAGKGSEWQLLAYRAPVRTQVTPTGADVVPRSTGSGGAAARPPHIRVVARTDSKQRADVNPAGLCNCGVGPNTGFADNHAKTCPAYEPPF